MNNQLSFNFNEIRSWASLFSDTDHPREREGGRTVPFPIHPLHPWQSNGTVKLVLLGRPSSLVNLISSCSYCAEMEVEINFCSFNEPRYLLLHLLNNLILSPSTEIHPHKERDGTITLGGTNPKIVYLRAFYRGSSHSLATRNGDQGFGRCWFHAINY